ncbi:hypothetical protein F2Q70_00015666 [Brassica cretica]|uniref:Uncharacterized protein n=1 Tax=Brassica cretica TaxID=69181 RepID=A0A8S9I140_BRACR|nr:hypothetical protein F2Q70_00015666 [Brassica cretica]KAF3538900.1 hypothetical protein F2Q69_00020206 [Brassica cretica]
MMTMRMMIRGHFGGDMNDFQEFEPVVRPTMESKYPLLEIEEVVAGDDEGVSIEPPWVLVGPPLVSHPPGSDDMDLITTVCAYYQ